MTGATLSLLDLGAAAALVLLLALLTWRERLNVAPSLLIAAARTGIQLGLIGLVLKALFAAPSPWWMVPLVAVMLLAAGHEVRARQQTRLRGAAGYWLGTSAMAVSCFSLTLLALVLLVQPEPWYAPRYLIPFLGMLLGNTMTGVALALERLFTSAREQQRLIEQRLMLGETAAEATLGLRRDALRAGLLPIINAMSAAGLVSLPGMMTGQILAGAEPMEAVKYQVLIMFLIAAATGFGAWLAVSLARRRLFDERERLRPERLLRRD